MFAKVPLSFIISIALIACSQNEQYQTEKTLVKNIMLSDLPNSYEFTIDTSKHEQNILFFNKSAKNITAGEIFQFNANISLYVNYIELSNYLAERLSIPYLFKLYINDKLIGKYKTGEKIKIKQKVTSLKILFLKTKNEHLVKGWSENTILKILKITDNHRDVFSPQIKLSVKSSQKINFEIFRNRKIHSKNALRLNKKIIEKFTIDNSLFVSGLTYKKNNPELIQYTIRLFDNGFFRIYQLISNKLEKKLVCEFFYEGNWQCTRFNTAQAQIEFEGKLTGYFPDKEVKIVQNKLIKITSILRGNLLKSNELLGSVYLDFPDDAFVNVKSLIPDIQVEMPYASSNNFTGEQLYPCNKCFLRYKVAKALTTVQTILKKKQMSLKLFDCYRPFSVQAIMFKKFPIPGYVADSIGGSVHNRGSAVDLSIIDKNGKALDMGTEYDELSPKSNHNYPFFSDTILKNRLFLKELMQSNNFVAIRSEWWHYNFVNARKFKKVDDAFLCD